MSGSFMDSDDQREPAAGKAEASRAGGISVGAGGKEGGEAMGGTGTKKDMVMLEANKDQASSCGKECSIKLDTPRNGATDVSAWGEQKWMGGTKTPTPWMKEGTSG
jgi:hypothetical protein